VRASDLPAVLLRAALLLTLTEALVRAACWVPAVRDAINHRYGPPSSELAWLYRPDQLDGAQSFTRYDPSLGWSNRPGLHHDLGGPVTINERGLRALPPPRAQPPRRRIALVGDSFTFGAEAGDGSTWADLLAQALPDDELLNLGVTGYGHDQMRLHYDRQLGEQPPDVLVLGFNAIDMSRTLLRFFTYAKPMILAETGDFTPVGSPVPPPEALASTLTRRSRLLWFAEMWRWRSYGTSSAFREDGVQRAGALLTDWFTELDAAGVQVVLLYLPMPMEYQDPSRTLAQLTAQSPERRWFQRACATPRPCADALPALLQAAAAGEDLDALSHWTPAGHRLVAQTVLPLLQSP
jgi:hypothetical protein